MENSLELYEVFKNELIRDRRTMMEVYKGKEDIFEKDFDDGGGQSLGSRPTGTTVLGRFTNCILGGGGAF